MSGYGGFIKGKPVLFSNWSEMKTSTAPQTPPNSLSFDYRYTKGIWNLGYVFSMTPSADPFGAEYGYWDGSRILFSTTFDSSGTTSRSIIDGSYDVNTQRMYDSYNNGNGFSYYTGGYWTWTNEFAIPNRPSAGYGSTIGYHNGVSYLYMASGSTVYIYNLSNLSFAASWNMSATGLSTGIRGLAYDGSGILATTGNNTIYKINGTNPYIQVPSVSTIISGLSNSTGYGLLFNGTSVLYRQGAGSSVWEVDLSTGTVLNTFTASTSGYGIAIDYANKYFYTGGHADTTIRRFPGV